MTPLQELHASTLGEISEFSEAAILRKRVRAIRYGRAAGIRMADIADALGVTRPTLYVWIAKVEAAEANALIGDERSTHP